MTPVEYLEALHSAGIPRDIGLNDIDRRAAKMLEIDERTARRYRSGAIQVPGPVKVALTALAI